MNKSPTAVDREFNAWVATVRDPADYRSEGPRIVRVGSCSAEYEIAPLPSGKWALRVDYRSGHSGGGHGWVAYESRAAALDAFLTGAHRYFSPDVFFKGCATNADKTSVPRILERLSPSNLFGFEEPDPLPRSEWWDDMIADRLGSMTTEQGWELLDVVRGMNCKPISRSGSFFDIPLTVGVKRSRNHGSDEEVE